MKHLAMLLTVLDLLTVMEMVSVKQQLLSHTVNVSLVIWVLSVRTSVYMAQFRRTIHAYVTHATQGLLVTRPAVDMVNVKITPAYVIQLTGVGKLEINQICISSM